MGVGGSSEGVGGVDGATGAAAGGGGGGAAAGRSLRMLVVSGSVRRGHPSPNP